MAHRNTAKVCRGVNQKMQNIVLTPAQKSKNDTSSLLVRL